MNAVSGRSICTRRLHLRRRRRLAARERLQPFDGVRQQLHVEVEADRADLAALLGAEQVAGAADLQVAQRDLEARRPAPSPRRSSAAASARPRSARGASRTAGRRTRAPRRARRGRAAGRAAPGRSVSAWLMMIVLTFGMSSPDSMIVVQTSTSTLPSAKSSITCSSWSSCICPWPMTISASGHDVAQLRAPPARCCGRGCGRSRPARRAPARAGSPRGRGGRRTR